MLLHTYTIFLLLIFCKYIYAGATLGAVISTIKAAAQPSRCKNSTMIRSCSGLHAMEITHALTTASSRLLNLSWMLQALLQQKCLIPSLRSYMITQAAASQTIKNSLGSHPPKTSSSSSLVILLATSHHYYHLAVILCHLIRWCSSPLNPSVVAYQRLSLILRICYLGQR